MFGQIKIFEASDCLMKFIRVVFHSLYTNIKGLDLLAFPKNQILKLDQMFETFNFIVQ